MRCITLAALVCLTAMPVSAQVTRDSSLNIAAFADSVAGQGRTYFATSVSGQVGAQTSIGRTGLAAGPIPHVGFASFAAGASTVGIWYPAASGGVQMRIRDFSGATRFSEPFLAAGVAPPALDSLLATPLGVWLGAAPLADSFPLILIAHGNAQDAVDQAFLSEYLASFGYVVASVTSPMVARPMTRTADLASFAEEQADALVEARRIAAPFVRASREGVAIVAHSFGARAALLYAMRTADVKAIVSLDGGIGTATGVTELTAARSFVPGARLPAVLHMYERLDAFMTPEFSFLTRLDVTRLELLATRHMHHVHFTTVGFLAAADPRIARLTRADAETAREVVAVPVETRRFIDNALKPVGFRTQAPAP